MMEVTGPAGNGVISWQSLGDMICIYYIWYILYIYYIIYIILYIYYILYILYYIYIIYYIYNIIYILYIISWNVLEDFWLNGNVTIIYGGVKVILMGLNHGL
jgi:hypothetical protein